ncbi:cell envelope integrity protein TolA, partial [Weissella minor]|uniref:cell envelope integrity protein TolA n=1 Tax=Weissella minor TaxID=1620 RepID=UPI001F2AED2F
MIALIDFDLDRNGCRNTNMADFGVLIFLLGVISFFTWGICYPVTRIRKHRGLLGWKKYVGIAGVVLSVTGLFTVGAYADPQDDVNKTSSSQVTSESKSNESKAKAESESKAKAESESKAKA